ncbi:glycosyltransferase family 2 protein [Caldibacillus lycopersici]|uniref:Glycosyltransferase family 2 protein n=1 Tax=Perspicuibacillus lycopersici TaxID=1325689 RepID=A0AAE3IYL8_9BACI|nr:glycosyltransferase family 2 protein [Perspicuibacillus lycopersici]MCU9614445.1 glycosyltransferase family 2 protein [Perspicuibacillus lycopersici]
MLTDNIFNVTGVKNSYMRPRIVAFIPAHNEEKSIRDCLEGLADQTLPKDIDLDVYVIADNCTDRTEERALQAGADFNLNLVVLTTKNNKQRKVGALNTAWKHIYGDNLDIYFRKLTQWQEVYKQSIKAVLGMDADSRLAPNALNYLWDGLMSSRNIGGVMAKYTMRMPKKKSALAKDDPHYEEKIASGEYGGPLTRWWTHQQKQDMASWILDIQYHGGSTYVLGGQATLFRPEALQDITEENKLDGPWQDESDVEDMLLTWQLQKSNWKTLVSPKARCFVDAMKSYHTFRQQRNKWQSGTVNLLTSKDIDVKTRHRGKLWRAQIKTFVDLITRVLFLLLLTVAIATDQFYWSWIWAIPVVLASILNMILAIKTPMHRTIDVVMAGLLISPEIYLWANLVTFCQVWLEKMAAHKKDGWANQYNAEGGKTSSKLVHGIILATLLVGIGVFLCINYRDFLTSQMVQDALYPYLMSGWVVLTYLTIFASIYMVYQIWTLRGRHSA